MNNPESLLLIPGLVCDEEVWHAQIALAGGWHVAVANHGRSDSLGGMAERILSAAPPRFALAGHSMGGRVALEIVARAPDRVARAPLAQFAAQMARRIPGSRLIAVPDCGHMCTMERPTAVTAALLEWLRG